MKNHNQATSRLVQELEDARRRIASLEAAQGECRQMQEAVGRSEAKLRNLFENLPDFVLVVDREARIQFVNRSTPGTGPQTLVGSVGFGHIVPEHRQACRDALRRSFDTGKVQAVEVHTVYDRWWDCRIVPVPGDGAVSDAMIICADVTQQKRAERLTTVQHRLATALSAARDLHEALDECVTAAMEVSEMDCGGICLVSEAGELDLVASHGLAESMADFAGECCVELPPARLVVAGETGGSRDGELPPCMDEIAAREGLRTLALLPVRHAGQAIACLHVGSHTRDDLAASARDALETIAAQIGAAVARLKAETAVLEEQRRLSRLLDMHERYRQLVAFEIHDGFTQPLMGALMQLEGCKQVLGRRCPELLDDGYESAVELLRTSVAEARRLMGGLRPAVLDEFGIVAAIGGLVADSQSDGGPEIEYSRAVQFARLAPPLETAVFRIVQEGLANALRHSESRRVRVALVQEGDCLRIEVEDWGVGFEPDEVGQGHFGLEGIRERARLFGGQAVIESAPGTGTRIHVDLPVVEPRPH